MNFPRRTIGLLLLIQGFAFPAWAQGPLQVVRTGMGSVLISTNQALTIPPSLNQELEFEFGFSTDELLSPGQFLDAVTISLEAILNNSTSVVIYATADRTGVNWAPASPGTVITDPDSILRRAINFPSLQPVFTNQLAYAVRAPVPPEWAGRRVTFYFDLFDNQNSAGSLGWVTAVGIVPEPGLSILFLLALGSLFLMKRLPH